MSFIKHPKKIRLKNAHSARFLLVFHFKITTYCGLALPFVPQTTSCHQNHTLHVPWHYLGR